MKSINVIFLLLLSIFLMQSCTPEELNAGGGKEEIQEAPELPEMSDFIMPFTGFTEADTNRVVSTMSNSRSLKTYKNWFYAATNLVVFQVAIATHMAIPVATFAEAFNHTPTHIGNGVFQWKYTVNDVSGNFVCRLTAEFTNDNNDEVEWNMYVSKVGAYSDVNFYTGITSTTEKSGTWTLRHKPNNVEDALLIEYGPDGNNGGQIKYTNIVPNTVDNGSYVEYTEIDGAEYDKTYDIFLAKEDNLVEILWSEANIYGKVKSPMFFNDEDFHCWDDTRADAICD